MCKRNVLAMPLATHSQGAPTFPTSRRLRFAAAGVSLLALAVFWAKALSDYFPGDWASVITTVQGSPFNGIEVALGPLGTSALKAGGIAAVARFHRRDGSKTTIYVVEGKFDPATIDPSNAWSSLQGAPLAIVSDVDENGVATNGIGRAIASGCHTSSPATPIALGTFQFTPCHAPYQLRTHIDEVADAYVVPHDFSNGVSPECNSANIEANVTKCVGLNVSSALDDIFTSLYNHRDIHGIIIPAIGTGYGRLSKKAFYGYLREDISTALRYDHYLPDYIYLQVYRQDSAKWSVTNTAISGALASLVKDWNKWDHSSADPTWTPLIGVLGGFGLLLLVVAIFPSVIRYEQLNLGVLGAGSIVVLLIGWLLSALGLAAVVRPFLPANLPYEVVVGFLIGFFTGPILRSARVVESRTPA